MLVISTNHPKHAWTTMNIWHPQPNTTYLLCFGERNHQCSKGQGPRGPSEAVSPRPPAEDRLPERFGQWQYLMLSIFTSFLERTCHWYHQSKICFWDICCCCWYFRQELIRRISKRISKQSCLLVYKSRILNRLFVGMYLEHRFEPIGQLMFEHMSTTRQVKIPQLGLVGCTNFNLISFGYLWENI